jgi:hypothetical protein
MNLNTISFALVGKAKANKTKKHGKINTSKQTAWGNDLIDLDNGYCQNYGEASLIHVNSTGNIQIVVARHSET